MSGLMYVLTIKTRRYNVGTMYVNEDCQECQCVLGGTPFCKPKKCEPCSELGMRPVVNELCNCVCKPCPAGTRHCPTSNVCIDESLWCNGIQDCPDDEKDCPKVVSTTPALELSTTQRNEGTTATSGIAIKLKVKILGVGLKAIF